MQQFADLLLQQQGVQGISLFGLQKTKSVVRDFQVYVYNSESQPDAAGIEWQAEEQQLAGQPDAVRVVQVLGRINNDVQQLSITTTLGREAFGAALSEVLAELQGQQ